LAAGSVNGGAMIGSELRAELESKLDSRIVEASPLPVGFGLTGLRIALADGRRLAVKARQAGESGTPPLELEAYMLGELARLSELPAPHVHYADADLLAMDFIETDSGGITASVERHAGELIAELHATRRERFGYARDTLIGPLRQPNPPSPRWIPFFRDHRLLYMANEAHQEGRLPPELLARIERLAELLEELLIEPAFPSLLHGDLWTGNVLTRGGRVAAFVDPAIYCGSPEIELAFGTLFGTFGEAFFAAYASAMPLEAGFHELRLGLYNLYPRLVHARLFGSSYLAGIDATLARLGF
jgi:fructosamine-3-kinase